MGQLHLLSPKGFRAAGVYAGIKSRQANDVGLLVCERPAAAAAAFTTNRVVAAPIEVGRRHIADGVLRAIVVNSGNANACTGPQGLRDAREMCQLTGARIGCPPTHVLPSSTGIIGRPLPMNRVRSGIEAAWARLGDSADHSAAFGDAILTTDTRRKSASVQLRIRRTLVTIAGICKGAGMIGPRLALASGAPARLRRRHATMLAYLTTDARIAPGALRRLFESAVRDSFNCVTIDDHTSTNDTAAILASGMTDAPVMSTAEQRKFSAALRDVCQSLARQIAADGEGATKLIRVRVTHAATPRNARLIARAIANSPLVKCAMHGNDPNWGRIISAAGMAGALFDPRRALLTLQETPVFRRGTPLPFESKELSAALNAPEVTILLDCGVGRASATVWTCDLSEDYVSINADYHT